MVATAAGFPLILVGGILSGWNWENIWLIYCTWGATLFPLILCFSTTEDPGVVFDNVRDVYVCICGLGWGIGSVLFGLGIVYVGNALTFGITLSLSSTVGSILPLFIFQTESAGKAIALFYWAGLVVAIVGVVVLSWAGITKEKEIAAKKGNRNGGGSTNDEVVGLDGSINNDVNDDDDDDSSSSSSSSGGISSDKDSNSSDDDDDFREEFDDGSGSNRKSKSEKRTQMEVGIVICVVSGVFSAMLNVGLASGDPIRVKAEECGTPKYVSNSPVWFLGICSGNFVNLGYAIYLLFKNKSWSKYKEQPVGVFLVNFFITFCMGLMWFGGLVVYGIGTIVIGDLGTSVGWPMYMVAMVLSSNIGAIILGEWKNTEKTSRIRMGVGLGFLALAIVLLALGSSLGGSNDNSNSSSSSNSNSSDSECFFSSDSNSTLF